MPKSFWCSRFCFRCLVAVRVPGLRVWTGVRAPWGHAAQLVAGPRLAGAALTPGLGPLVGWAWPGRDLGSNHLRSRSSEQTAEQDAPLMLTVPSFSPPTEPSGDDPGSVATEETPSPGPAFTPYIQRMPPAEQFKSRSAGQLSSPRPNAQATVPFLP